MRERQILVNKPIYLVLPLLKLSKIVMYEFWYDYVKLKHGEKSKLYYRDTDSFIIHITINYIYKYIMEDVETRFDTHKLRLEQTIA